MPYYVYAIHTDQTSNRLYDLFEDREEAAKLKAEMAAGRIPSDNYFVRMFFAENEAQPDRFSSIPVAMWWSIVTLTTVGYGDVFPVTGWGKALAGVIAMLGIGLFALPAGILGSGFLEEIQHRNQVPIRCPHCGVEISE